MKSNENRCHVAIMGNYFSGINTLSGAIHKLGLIWRDDPDDNNIDNRIPMLEDKNLNDICRQSYQIPQMCEKLPYEKRLALLREWMEMQNRRKPGHVRYLCGMNPVLSLMGKELQEAWHRLMVLVVDRPDEDSWKAMQEIGWDWDLETVRHVHGKFRDAREQWIKTSSVPILCLEYEHMMRQSHETVVTICRFLDHSPASSEEYHDAAYFIQKTRDDVYVIPY